MNKTFITVYELKRAYIVATDVHLKRFVLSAVAKCNAIKVLGLVIEDTKIIQDIKRLSKIRSVGL